MTIPYDTTTKRQPLGYLPKPASVGWWFLVRHSGESTLLDSFSPIHCFFCALELSELEFSCLHVCRRLTQPFAAVNIRLSAQLDVPRCRLCPSYPTR